MTKDTRLKDAIAPAIKAFRARTDTHAGHAANLGRDLTRNTRGIEGLLVQSSLSGPKLHVRATAPGHKDFSTSFDWTKPTAVRDGAKKEVQ